MNTVGCTCRPEWAATGIICTHCEVLQLRTANADLAKRLEEAESIKNGAIDFIKAEGFELSEDDGLTHPMLDNLWEEPADGVGDAIKRVIEDLQTEEDRAEAAESRITELEAELEGLREAVVPKSCHIEGCPLAKAKQALKRGA